MRGPALAIALFSTIFVVSLFAQTQAPAFAPRASADKPQESEYVGSAACESCHKAAYDSWRQTLHVQMTRPIADARVEGDFRRVRLQQYGRSYAMETRNGRYYVSVANGSRPAEEFEVHYTLGARRFQGYLSKLPDGRIYVLPVFWHNDAKRWVDWKEITPIPDDPDHDLRQIWNVTCVNCHATNLAKNFDPATRTYNTTWTEMGVACEACHGPGRAHAANTPKSIFAPSKADTREVFDMCAYCHGNKNNVFYGFKPGDRYEDFALPFLVGQPIPDNDPQGDFWPDGRPSRFNRPQALTLTGCFRSGEATCTSCHRMHGSNNSHSLKVEVDLPGGGHTKQSDTLCTQCHTGPGGAGGAEREASAERLPAEAPSAKAGWTSHTHHAADSQGSRCVGCHMSEVSWRMITRRRDHTFQAPVPEMTARFGAPNACTTCHEDKTPEWAAAKMDAWYGNRARRDAVVAMSDTLYRAGAGDVGVLPDVARLAADRSHGTLIRASAAELAGQLIARAGMAGGSGQAGGAGPDALNALVGAAADPEAAVRIAAVRALGLARDRRFAPALAARLTDQARLARVSAAEALLRLGIVKIEGASGERLERAQDEWASSLKAFNDVAADQATLAWLEGSRGRIDEAVAALRAVKQLDPAYPNVDRLLDEAQKTRK